MSNKRYGIHVGDTGLYFIRDTLTGLLVVDKNNRLRSFNNQQRAFRAAAKLETTARKEQKGL